MFCRMSRVPNWRPPPPSAGAANPNADMASPKKVDDKIYENTWKKGGEVAVVARRSVDRSPSNGRFLP
jgi:hypothetical protein